MQNGTILIGRLKASFKLGAIVPKIIVLSGK